MRPDEVNNQDQASPLHSRWLKLTHYPQHVVAVKKHNVYTAHREHTHSVQVDSIKNSIRRQIEI